MTLYTNCILNNIVDRIGIKYSVMSRHTLEDGMTPDIRIVKDINYDIHIKQLGPSPYLIGSYLRNEITWDDYEKLFYQEMRNPEKHEILEKITLQAKELNIYLLCIEEKPDFCHRRLLAEICKKINPNLEIIIR